MKFQPDLSNPGDPQPLPTELVSSPSVIKILSGALDAIAERGVRRLSMSDIIEASGVSRGTLYRYFSNKDDVLAAVSEYVCIGFENGIKKAAEDSADPMERFRNVIEFYARYTNENSPDRVFEVEPRFHLEFFRNRFLRYKVALREALKVSIDYIDRVLGQPIDRDGFVEALVRLQLSTLVVPADDDWLNRWNNIPDNIESWAMKFPRQFV